MQFRQFIQLRHLSTSRNLFRPSLTAEYKSNQLWENRFNCRLLSDNNIIKSINSKILMDAELNNLEVDIFVNIAAPRTDEIAQLQEAARALQRFRKTLYAHKLLPSTSHAICRLFIDSGKLPSLINLLEDRVQYGVFPDWFMLNLIFDQALEAENFSLASRAAALIMIQEEFGLNEMSDKFSLYSVARYIETKPDFSDWLKWNKNRDPIFTAIDQAQLDQQDAAEKAKSGEGAQASTDGNEEAEEEDEEEEDAEYIRIPWLRNAYFDNHFDLTSPRQICGRTLTMIGSHLEQSAGGQDELANKCNLLGSVLEGNWSSAVKMLEQFVRNKTPLGANKELIQHYVENLHDVKGPDDGLKNTMISNLNQVSDSGPTLSEEAEQKCTNFRELEKLELDRYTSNLSEWSKLRQRVKEQQEEVEARKQLIEQIRAKKEELRLKEQYLYFYDNLKKSSLTRTEYN